MAKSLDDERAAIAADEERLADRRKRLAERERDAALAASTRRGCSSSRSIGSRPSPRR
jgi:hypothetical protein